MRAIKRYLRDRLSQRTLPVAVLVVSALLILSHSALAGQGWQASLAAANALVARGKPADAEKQLVLAWQDVSQHGQPMDQLLVLLQKGGNEIALNDFATALQTFQTGAAIARQNNLAQPLGDMLAYSAECYRLSKSYDLALAAARDSRAAYQSANDTADQAFPWVTEGRVYQDQGKLDQALKAFAQSLALSPYNFAAVRGTAECDRALGDFAGAEQALIAALPHETGSSETLTSQLLGDCYFDWARSLADKQDEAGAIATARKAIQVYAAGQPARAAEALAWLGSYLSGCGHIAQALLVDKAALELSVKVKSKVLQFYALSDLANDYQRSGQSTPAFAAASQSIAVARSSGDATLAPKAYAVAALVAAANGYGDLAQTYSHEEWQAAQHAGDPNALAVAANDLAFQAFIAENFPASISWRETAEKYESAGSNTLVRRQTLLGLGQSYGSLENTGLAQKYFIQAADLADQAGDYISERNALIGDAVFEARARRVEVVIADGAKLDTLFKSHPEATDPTGQLGVQIGNIMISAGQFAPARNMLNQAHAEARRSGARDVEAQADLALGYTRDQLHDYKGAASLYRQALALYTAAGNNRQIAQTLLSLGFDEIHAGDLASAKAHVARALKLEPNVSDPADRANLLSTLGYLYSSEGDLAAAVSIEKTAVSLVQGMRPAVQALGAAYDASFIRGYRQIYEYLSECLIRQGRLDEAEQVIGLIKAREFDQFQSRGGAPMSAAAVAFTPGELRWRARYQAIAGRITALGRVKEGLLARQALAKTGQGTFTPQDQKRLVAVNSDLGIADQAFDAFLSSVPKDFANPSIAAQKSSQIAQVAKLRDTIRSLGPGAVLVYTLIEDDKYRAIVVTGETQKAEQYPIDSRKLAAKILAFRALIQDPDSDPRPAAKELYDIIVGPIAGDLAGAGAKTILWSLDGVLRYLPIAALYDGRQYMVERYGNVLFTLTSPVLAAGAPKATWSAVGMGVSKAQPGFEALPSVPDELHEVVRETAGAPGILPGEIMLDNQFTQSSFLQALSEKKYAVVHIASHYAFHPGTDQDSFLLLGDGAHLSLAAIDALPNIFDGVGLVTLSACDTANGDAGDGREIDGLAFTAEREGAQAVLATLWPIADESTQIMMKSFYAYYESHPNATKADALRYAQLELLHGSAGATTLLAHRGDPLLTAPEPDAPAFPYNPKAPFAHPYFWAPFILLGNVR